MLEAVEFPNCSKDEYDYHFSLLSELFISLKNAKMFKERKDEILRNSYITVNGYMSVLKARKMLKGIYVQDKLAEILGVSKGKIAKFQRDYKHLINII